MKIEGIYRQVNRAGLITTLLLIAACQSTPENKDTAIRSPDAFRTAFAQTITHYLATKDALVAADGNQATAAARALMASLPTVPVDSLSEEDRQRWEKHREKLMHSATALHATPDVEEKRIKFEGLSDALYAAVQDFGASQTLYKQYCPMAFDNAGAAWLSAQEEIRNPYFGDAMLQCGEVEEVIRDEITE